MSASREDVIKTAMELTEVDRLLLATDLMETISGELQGWALDDPNFAAELDRRADDGSAGIPWETIRAELLADLGR
jgi:putative addiction module component (TIGR02574 family)